MKKFKSSTGCLYIESEKTEKFVSWPVALMAAQNVQFLCAQQGFMTNCGTSPLGSIEVRVHLNGLKKPVLGKDMPTYHNITSQPFWNDYEKCDSRCRVITYYFEH